MVKITTLIENTPDELGQLRAEHGFSLWIEDGGTNILFDMGQSGQFIQNAQRLGIDLEKTDFMFISHAHYDHAGGILDFLKTFSRRPELWLSACFFSQGKKFHYTGDIRSGAVKSPERRYIGVNFSAKDLLAQGVKPRYIKEEIVRISPSVYAFCRFPRRYAFETLNPAMELETAAGFKTDPFDDEIALGVVTASGVIVLLGCAHPGFLNMADAVAQRTGKKIAGIIGGTHLVEASTARTALSIQTVREMDVHLLGLSHCTGGAAAGEFQKAFPGAFVNRTGTSLQV